MEQQLKKLLKCKENKITNRESLFTQLQQINKKIHK